MSDELIRAAWRKWKSEPTAENALQWAVLCDRADGRAGAHISAADVFGNAPTRILSIVDAAMSRLRGRRDAIALIPLTDVARLSESQWRGLRNCGDVTVREIKRRLEENGLVMSSADDDLFSIQQERAGQQRLHDGEILELRERLAFVTRERDAIVAALSIANKKLDEAERAKSRPKSMSMHLQDGLISRAIARREADRSSMTLPRATRRP